MTPYNYDNAVQVTISDENNDLIIYHVCSNCEFAVKHFMKNKIPKAGEHNDM